MTATISTPLELFDLSGQHAVVTGASSGLGRRFAQVLAAAGAQVLAVARRGDLLATLAEENANITAFTADLSREEDRAATSSRALELFPTVDVLVNNVGISNIVRAEDETVSDFESVLGLNLVSAFSMSQHLGRSMLNHGGSIVNVSSIHGAVSSAPINQASYNASKAGLIGLTRELAGQWGRRGVRVNALAPGYFKSELTAQMWSEPSTLAYLKRNTALARGGEAGELDGALLLLASPAGSYITGTTLFVDGGWTSR
ncbi:SDR family NAD(P)-dependent oxidoreductase [Rhodococcus aetherivorans]